MNHRILIEKSAALLVCLISFFEVTNSFGQNGLEKIIVERYYISTRQDSSQVGGRLPEGSTTYRIYVDMLPGYSFQAAYGVPNHELSIQTSTVFFNHEDFGGTVANVIPNMLLKDNTVMLDSWLSVGAAAEGYFGVLKSEDDTTGTIVHDKGYLLGANKKAGIPLTQRDGLLAGQPKLVTGFGIDSAIVVLKNKSNGALFSLKNGSWACMGGAVGPTKENRVLIAQITTDGVLSFELNIQIGTPGGAVEQYVARNPKGEERTCMGLIYSSASEK
jgi:hypothetical protein